MRSLNYINNEAYIEKFKFEKGCKEEAEGELHRLAKELKLPDNGPCENVNGAIAMVKQLFAEKQKETADAWVTRMRRRMLLLERIFGPMKLISVIQGEIIFLESSKWSEKLGVSISEAQQIISELSFYISEQSK